MKNLLLISALLIGTLAGMAQVPIGCATCTTEIKGILKADSLFLLPFRHDTLVNPGRGGAIVFAYGRTWLYTGTQWGLLTGITWATIPGSPMSNDSLAVVLNLKQNQLKSGYGWKLVGDTTGVFDSAVVRKVDTIFRLNDSTLRFVINGWDTINVLIRGSASGTIVSSIALATNPGMYANPIVYTNTSGAWKGNLFLLPQASGVVLAGPPIAGTDTPRFRRLVPNDLPAGIPIANLTASSINFAFNIVGAAPGWSAVNTPLGGTATLNIPLASLTSPGLTSTAQVGFWNGKVDSTTQSNDSIYEWRNGARFFRYIVTGGGGGGTVTTTNSVIGTGSGGSPIQLSGDVTNPGATAYYGTNAAGTKGYYVLSYLPLTWGANQVVTANGDTVIITGGALKTTGGLGPLIIGNGVIQFQLAGSNSPALTGIGQDGNPALSFSYNNGTSTNWPLVARHDSIIFFMGSTPAVIRSNGTASFGNNVTATLFLQASGDTAATKAYARSLLQTPFDSATTQNASTGGGFHTMFFNDTRYIKRADSLTNYATHWQLLDSVAALRLAIIDSSARTFNLNIVKSAPRGINPLWGHDNILIGKSMVDSGAFHWYLNNDSSLTGYAYVPSVPMRNEFKINLTNNNVYEGNSITVCATCPFPLTQGYTVLINDTMSLTATTNRAFSNSSWMDMLSRQFLNDPSGGAIWSYSIMGGENNFGEDTSVIKWPASREALRTSIANHFMDTAWAISSSTITKSGTWSNITSANLVSKSLLASLGNPMKSSTVGNSLTATVYDNNVVIGTYGWKAGDGYGSVSITIDGILMVNPLTQSAVWTGQNLASHFTSQIGTYDTRQPIVWVFAGLGIGAHTVVITLLSSNETDFDYIGKMMPPSRAAGMMVFHVTKRTPAGYFSYSDVGGGPAGIDSMNRNIDTVTNFFRGLGLPVATIHTNEFLSNALYYTDGLHFLPSGHVQLANAALTVINRAQNGGGGIPLSDTATTSSPGFETPTDKIIITHPLYVQNDPYAPGTDTLAQGSIDTLKFRGIKDTSYDGTVTITNRSVGNTIIHDFHAGSGGSVSGNYVDTVYHYPDSATIGYHYHNGALDLTKFNNYNPTSLTVGGFDGGTANSNGLYINAGNIYAQSASASNPGMLNTGVQTIAGTKTFNNAPNLLGSSTVGYVWTATNTTGGGIWNALPLVNVSVLNSTLTLTGGGTNNVALSLNLGNANTWTAAQTIQTPILGTSSTSGYVWTATNTTGSGSWQIAGTVVAGSYTPTVNDSINVASFSLQHAYYTVDAATIVHVRISGSVVPTTGGSQCTITFTNPTGYPSATGVGENLGSGVLVFTSGASGSTTALVQQHPQPTKVTVIFPGLFAAGANFTISFDYHL